MMLSAPSEFRKEINTRLNALKVLLNYKSGNDIAPFPGIVILVMNEHCNQRCRICDIGRRVESSFYYNSHFKNKGVMSRETFMAIVDSLKGHGSEIWFLAAEPLIYPDLLWAIDYASSCGIDSQITTNGFLLPDMVEDLARKGIKRICLSIDAYSEELHDFIRDCPGSYRRVIDGLEMLIAAKKRLNKKRPYIFINTAISQWNYDSLGKLIEKLSSYDIDGIILSHLQFLTEEAAALHTKTHQDFAVTGRNIQYSGREGIKIEVLFREIMAIKKKYGKYRINITPPLETLEEMKVYYHCPDKYVNGHNICYMPWRYPHILANGDVVVNYECFSKTMGNINEQKLDSIWNGDRFRSFRRFIRKNSGSTPACWRCPMIYCGYKL
ncbi:MAG: radical SAM protein [Candidatus Omnitrophota bacterium]|nr:radical SAM protein [Candidatus Omnitrophota bacterium]